MNSNQASSQQPQQAGTSTQALKIHPLYAPFALYYSHRNAGTRTQLNFQEKLTKIAVFRTVEDFWAHYKHLRRPDELKGISDYHLFKEGIEPLWEDEANRFGGKWIVRLRKGLASRYWEDLVLAVLGNQFDVGDEVCGAVISVRYNEDIISLWNRSADNRVALLKIKDTIKRVLQLPTTVTMEYKGHDASLRDNSSFRNTDVFSAYEGLLADKLKGWPQANHQTAPIPTSPQPEHGSGATNMQLH